MPQPIEEVAAPLAEISDHCREPTGVQAKPQDVDWRLQERLIDDARE